MYKTVFACTVVMAMSAVPALAQPPARGTQPTPTTSGTQASTPKTEDKRNPDQPWVIAAARDGIAEVEIGRLASEKASTDQVKEFAKKMVDDHGKANDELKSIASTKNITVPTDADAKHKATIDRLSKLSGEAFDRAFAQVMLSNHKKAVSAFRTESKSGNDPELKAFAAKTLPTLEGHLKEAEDLNKSVVATSGVKEQEKPKSPRK
jgi:putative membrane protein